MIDRTTLLADLKPVVGLLEDDLRQRCVEFPDFDAGFRTAFERAKAAGRTGETYKVWREAEITQVAVAWILACVFARFLEDNHLVGEPRLSGPGPALQRARDHRTWWFQQHPTLTDRDYLLDVFHDLRRHPALASLYDPAHNPLFTHGLSADGATALLHFWQKIAPQTGTLLHDFTDPGFDTRFLGDIYQDLSEAVRKRYALLQTPDFVEAFILDRTLEPAIATFGYQGVRLIDPTCGSGHFLLGAFHRIFSRWQRDEPGTNPAVLAQRTLDHIAGTDINPAAIAIARFRLLLAAMQSSGITRLADAPAFTTHLAVGDSLLHGPRPGDQGGRQRVLVGDDPLKHVYDTEDADLLRQILGRPYHAVVGNPPYITPKDKALNAAYREAFGSCHRQYSLGVPFTERFFDLARTDDQDDAGYVGMITTNSFMKREFGKKLIEEFIPKWDLTHVLDTAGAYIPGHGTPTVILFGRSRKPTTGTVRAAMGIRGEPSTPDDAAKGLVWSAIVDQLDRPGSESAYVSVADVERKTFGEHPWSLGGGGAAELKERIEGNTSTCLSSVCREIGFGAVTREDDVYLVGADVCARHGIPMDQVRPLVAGEDIRDWGITGAVGAIWPFDPIDLSTVRIEPIVRFLWLWRTQLSDRVAYGKTQIERGLEWHEYSMFFRERFRTPLSIAFAFVATHNHFVLDRGGKVFNRTAPVIKLTSDATEDDHLALLGLLNSSTACFWMKQVCFPKGGDHVGTEGARVRKTLWDERYEHDGTKLQKFPVAASPPLDLAIALDTLAATLQDASPSAVCARWTPDREDVANASAAFATLRRFMIAYQEELDWRTYRLYGLLDAPAEALDPASIPEVDAGERAFEIVMARRIAAGELDTVWFERHGTIPITDIPFEWPEPYRQLVQRRIDLIASNPAIDLIERPEYKRRWNTEPFEEQLQRALRSWLLDRLESPTFWPSTTDPRLQTCARLADIAGQDPDFMQVAALYRGREDFDVTKLVTELVESEAVPYLPVLRYKPAGRLKREAWEETWTLQREEDAVDARTRLPVNHPDRVEPDQAEKLKAASIGTIPVPPKYASSDFLSATLWRLRGKLDVPKERFVSYPFAEREVDPTPVVAWAGWDHLQQARALAAYYTEMKDHEGWSEERRLPLLLGLQELVPWLLQWHNDLDPEFGRLGDFFRDFVENEARAMGKTVEDLRAYEPPKRTRGRGRKPKEKRA